jgi:hypothetical protein
MEPEIIKSSSNPLPFKQAEILKINPTASQWEGKLVIHDSGKPLEVDVSVIRQDQKSEAKPLNQLEGMVFFDMKLKGGESVKVGIKTNDFAILNSKLESARLQKLGLTKQEYDKIVKYYEDHKLELEKNGEYDFFRRNKDLSRSLVYVGSEPKNCAAPQKGIYVALKTHGNIPEAGLGSIKRATLMLYLDAQDKADETRIFCTGLHGTQDQEKVVKPNEIKMNKVLQSRPDLFVVGPTINYLGPHRSRSGDEFTPREANMPSINKNRIERQENVLKTGFILENLEGGDLIQFFIDNQKRTIPFKEALSKSYEIANALAVLHDEFKLVHGDLKPENIFLTKDGKLKLGDFGNTCFAEEVHPWFGSPNYFSPEMIEQALVEGEIKMLPSTDVWALGVIVLAYIGGLAAWTSYNGHEEGLYDEFLDELEDIKKDVFRDVTNLRVHKEGPMARKMMDTIIRQVVGPCLQVNPNLRPTARQVADKLLEISKMLS